MYALLKTYILSEVGVAVTKTTRATIATTSTNTSTTTTQQTTSNASVTETSYQDDNIAITIDTVRVNVTTAYVADITLSSSEYLKTALAKDTYGTNITATTSQTAEANQAIFAVNGDYYGANSKGYVIKNGVLYRDTVRSSSYEDLAIYADGSLATFKESDVSAESLLNSGVVQTFAFGPTLVKDYQIAISTSEEVAKAMSNNPRTAIGWIDDTHYIIIVSDGRTNESQGLTLYEMAELMQSYGVKIAYNLDGGGSATMYFNGKVVNQPTTNETIG